MKSTQWISNKLKETNDELDFLTEQIEKRAIPEDRYKEETYFLKSGQATSLTITERLNSLVGKKMILEEILK